MMEDLVGFGFIWILIGSVVWALSDPARYADYVTQRYLQRNGQWPGDGYLVLSIVMAIVQWPRLVPALIRRGRV